MRAVNVFFALSAAVCHAALAVAASDPAQTPVFTSCNGLTMCGYQGWFNTPGDGADLGWKHYQKDGAFEPGKCNIDLWPDMTEYETGYATPFRHADGSAAQVFSSHDASTVNLHFRWMREYGIDGAFMQRFVVSLRTEKSAANSDHILRAALAAAEENGRALCVMYDLSGMGSGDGEILIADWKKLADEYRLTDSRNYLRHNGKPLVAVWGVGFSKEGRKYNMDDAWQVVDFLRGAGCSVLLGVPTSWRTLDNDAVSDPRLHEIIMRADIVQPWLVGRFSTVNKKVYRDRMEKDVAWCREHGRDYLPVLFPGFSWHNMRRGQTPLDATPRRGGQFFWDQVAGAVGAGAKCLYLAMFDEMDEGTAFFKCTNDPPVGASPFVTYEGLPSDHYLWLAGQAARMLRGETPVSNTIPTRE